MRFLLAATLGLSFACQGGGPYDRAVELDLAAVAPAADIEAAYDLVLPGTPAAAPLEEEGFEAGSLRRRSRLRLFWPEVKERTLVLDLTPLAGAVPLRVFLNGHRVARLSLGRERARHAVLLPAADQGAGENRIAFVFGTEAEASSGPLARLHSVAVGPPGELAPLAVPGARPALDLVPETSVLSLAPGLGLRYVVSAPEGGVLRFAASAQAGTLRAQVNGRDVWERRGPFRGDFSIPVSTPPGDPLSITLRAEESWGTWERPQLVGRGSADLLDPPAPDRSQTSLQGLRGSLASSSVLLVVLDAASAGHFGAYGAARPTTPEIDRLASEGLLFERAYTPAAFTLSAMSSIWTSQRPDVHHAGVAHDAPLPDDPLTLGELLTAHGIHTAGFVTSGMAGRALGLDRGFAEFHEVFGERGHRASALTAELPGFLQSVAGRRFFLYLHVREPHFPFDPAPPFDTLFGPDRPITLGQRRDGAFLDAANDGSAPLSPAQLEHLGRLYDGNLASADRELGQMRAALEAAGVWQDLVVIVTGDHGEALGEHGFVGHNEQLFEESVHVPLVLRFPHGPAGLRIEGLVSHLDLAPTVADVFGVKPPPPFQGQSLLPVALGSPGRQAVLLRTAGERPTWGLRTDTTKYLFDSRSGDESLYLLESDPGEVHDVSDEQPSATALHRQSLWRWLLELPERRERPPAARRLTPEQRENLKALGYLP